MNLSAKTQYACLALLELAQNCSSSEPVQVRLIAQRHGIPPQFLVQILQQLKRAALVTSTRGASGGYQLARTPSEITLAEVLDVVEGHHEPVACAADNSPLAPLLVEVCVELASSQREQLEAITLADLLDRAALELDPMWYI